MTETEGTFEVIDFDEDDEPELEKKKPDDLSSAIMGFFSTLNLKLLLFIFLLFIFITSDIFVNKILGRIDGATQHREPTGKGTFIQGFFLAFFYMILDLVIKLGFI